MGCREVEPAKTGRKRGSSVVGSEVNEVRSETPSSVGGESAVAAFIAPNGNVGHSPALVLELRIQLFLHLDKSDARWSRVNVGVDFVKVTALLPWLLMAYM
ncbi:hypothetical protein NPIL_427521 [Nephila pilipes]|uniref:Uncharacterized protein n=1 Tax=Nephila pilipes TaxID=299642 RepID=A0A8X6Q202_NEPPI|nr:hypothetical protein NPIL_427521 [Nephila pilipes]